MRKEVRVALIGYGGIARSHCAGYDLLKKEGAPVRLVAVCDIDPKKFGSTEKTNLGESGTGLADDIHTYTDLDKMLAGEEFDMVDICLPSYLHREYAVKMLKAGKHVLSEKPMALTAADCLTMLRTAKETGRRLMIGQCLRFEPSYLYLKECIDTGRFGRLKSLYMDRLSAQPMWGFEGWYTDTEKSGGCIMDLHIHDIDMARFLLGEPESVSSVATDGITRWQVVNTRMFYPGTLVIADGSWGEASGTKFRFGFRARFEQATVILDHGKVTVYPEGGSAYEVELAHKDRMAEEIRTLANAILDPDAVLVANPPESAYRTVALIETLRRSADEGGTRITL